MNSFENLWFAKVPTGYCEYGSQMRELFGRLHKDAFRPSALGRLIDSLPLGSKELQIKQMANVQNWQRSNGVTVFPSEDLVQKCIHTEALGSISGTDLRESFPTILFTIPKSQALVIGDDSDPTKNRGRICHLLMSIYDDAEPLTIILNGEAEYAMKMPLGARHLLITAFWDHNFVNSFSVPLTDKSLLETFDDLRGRYVVDELRSAGMEYSSIEQEHQETQMISEWSCSLVVNFLLLMQSYPNFIQRADESQQRPHVYRNRPKPVAYSLRCARSLLPPSVVESDSSPESFGQYASPSAHWRRGHWRRQPHTARWHENAVANGTAPSEILLPDGRTAHMVWLEPVFVGVQKNAIASSGQKKM
jgi:hypothetical protein